MKQYLIYLILNLEAVANATNNASKNLNKNIKQKKN
jgi:hypothetical protein